MGGQQSSHQPSRNYDYSRSRPPHPQQQQQQYWEGASHSHPQPPQNWNYPPASYPPNYAVPYPAPQSQPHQPPHPGPAPQRKLNRRYSVIADQYHSADQVTEALAQAGLESSNLIVGIDFTKSNEWTGKHSFHGRSLHHVGDSPNPYEHAISIIGHTLSRFDDDNLIPCYGFGDASTHDRDVFSFYPDDRPCNGFPEALKRYRELVPQVRLAGPTSFAPIVEMAMTIVEKSGGQYHVLLIIADGQVTRSIDTDAGRLSPQEQMTVDAIVRASEFPLSIVLVGVGDGPWDTMKEFDDNIPARSFDNFQFVNFTEIMSKNLPQQRKEAEFALRALMEIPLQYKATIELGILGRQSGRSPNRVALPPPGGTSTSTSYPSISEFSKPTASPYPAYDSTKSSGGASFPEPSLDAQQFVCPICLVNPKDMAFGCGHQTCVDCSQSLQMCPICRSPIQTRIKLY
ncbi:Copine-like protein [Rhynchospora pubera]|uniref:Copine-like protein n=1 Tax=Rhynchospora pubera TaxID=906938 RepID=A0AAV8DWK6_9POAL|nr:Copine-like protein [Rhynchospora pubera]KAJ4779692.1 Copine-like protein [Rhynchospora pubera]